METRSKKKLFNGIMILLILLIAASGFVTVGMIQGWFEKEQEPVVVTEKVKGVVNIERKGIGYTLKRNTALISGDIVETKKGALAELSIDTRDVVVANENTEFGLFECKEDEVRMTVKNGELFGDVTGYDGAFGLEAEQYTADVSGAVFAVSVQAGSTTVSVFAGEAGVVLPDGTKERVETGESLLILTDGQGGTTATAASLQAASLNEFLITQAQGCSSSDDLCFTAEDLQQVLDDRAAEKQAALEASLKAENRIPSTDKAETDNLKEEKTAQESQTEEAKDSQTGVQEAEEWVEEYVEGGAEEVHEDVSTCTISIVCDTILDNLDNLDDGKEAYVPANGCILATSAVEFTEGETVFDVLNRVCEYAGIQIEYSWTPMYNSYYIEGINHLYEFDCGNESGWMYKVNGWFPNYGCSSYYLEDGDTIVWCYTCNGLGADVGGGLQ